MDQWRRTQTRPALLSGAGAVSLVLHGLLVITWIVATAPAPSLPRESLSNRVYYIPPPNPAVLARSEAPRLRYEAATRNALPSIGVTTDAASHPARARPKAPTLAEQFELPAPLPAPAADSAFTEWEVDVPVARSQYSAAPMYPKDLLDKKIEGAVYVQFVVDSTGAVDTTTIHIIRATNEAFVQSVRDAITRMRFVPARNRGKAVRQEVEQPFMFRIETTAIVDHAAPSKPKPAPGSAAARPES